MSGMKLAEKILDYANQLQQQNEHERSNPLEVVSVVNRLRAIVILWEAGSQADNEPVIRNPKLQEALDEMTVDEMIPVEKDMHCNLTIAMQTIKALLKDRENLIDENFSLRSAVHQQFKKYDFNRNE